MKVYISPFYINFDSTTIARKILFWSNNLDTIFAVSDFIDKHFGGIIDKIAKKLPSELVYVKIDNKDLWNLDETLRHVIKPALIKLREEKFGSPRVDNEDVPENLWNHSADPLKDDTVHERWDWVLDEMIYAFSYDYSNDDDYFTEPAVANRIKNGYRLFGKYYQALWT